MPDVAIGILVDESGSMCNCGGRRHSRSQDAMRVCIALVEAFRKLIGLKLCVYGHDHTSRVNFRHYITPANDKPAALCQIDSRSNNADGFAMLETIRQVHANFPDVRQRIVFVLSDGLPCASGYGGSSAMDHMRDVSGWGEKKLRIKTYGIGISGSPRPPEGDQMYGPGRFVMLHDVVGSARIMANFVAKVASAE